MRNNGKWPRHYAAAYLAAKTKQEQVAALKGCPKEYQELVRSHVKARIAQAKSRVGA